MFPRAPTVTANRLLEGLPADELERFVARSERVILAFGETLAEPHMPLSHVYFPTEGFVSLITNSDARSRLEVGLIGNEGMLGASLMLGIDESPIRALVQGGGTARCMEAGAFRRELAASPEMDRIVKRYLHVLIAQLAQTAACSRFHRLEARLARWLLMAHDRTYSDVLDITHEVLAFMLGVRRAGISVAASALQKRKLIHYRRGCLTILDREGLEAAACGCYLTDRETYARTMA